jgi:hypothetical protein
MDKDVQQVSFSEDICKERWLKHMQLQNRLDTTRTSVELGTSSKVISKAGLS